MKRKKRPLLSWLLVLAMLFSALPMTAFAEEEEKTTGIVTESETEGETTKEDPSENFENTNPSENPENTNPSENSENTNSSENSENTNPSGNSENVNQSQANQSQANQAQLASPESSALLGAAPVAATETGIIYGSGESGARVYRADNGDVFLGGNYIELGLRPSGAFGTETPAPTDGDMIFHPKGSSRGAIGLRSNGDKNWLEGLATGNDETVDFFLPDTIDEGYIVGWSTQDSVPATAQGYAQAYGGSTSSITAGSSVDVKVTGEKGKETISASTTATVNGTVLVTQTVSFGVDDKYFTLKVTMTNNDKATLYDMSYIRAFDPDQRAHLTGTDNATDNYFYKDKQGNVWVIAFGNDSLGIGSTRTEVTFEEMVTNNKNAMTPFVFCAKKPADGAGYDVQAVDTVVGWSSYSDFYRGSSSYKAGDDLYNIHYYQDTAIGMEFIVPKLEPGKSITFELASSLDSDVENTIDNMHKETEVDPPDIDPIVLTLSADVDAQEGHKKIDVTGKVIDKAGYKDYLYYTYKKNEEAETEQTELAHVIADGENKLDISGTVDLSDEQKFPPGTYTFYFWVQNDEGIKTEKVERKITITEDKKIEIEYAVTALAEANGTAVANPTRVKEGESATLTATANTGFGFGYWEITGTCTVEGDEKTSTLTLKDIKSDIIATAYFGTAYDVTVRAEEGGSAVANKASVLKDSNVTLTATANSKYKFDHWEITGEYNRTGVTLTKSKLEITGITSNIIAVAYFKEKSHSSEEEESGADGGAAFTVNKTDEAGEALSGATFVLKNSNGEAVYKATSDEDGVARFTDVADGSYTLTEKKSPSGYKVSTDSYELTVSGAKVTMNGKDYSAVTFVNEKVMLNTEDHFAFLAGYTDGTFGPDRNMTRAEVTAMFARLLTEKMDASKTYTNDFSDVPATHWAANCIGYMEQFGIISGYEDGTFRPDAPVSRAEFAAIASRFDKLTDGDASFPDVPATHWAAKHISFAAERGWVGGYPDGTFRPNNSITRAEVASVVCRMLGRSADLDYIKANPSALRSFGDVAESHWAYKVIMEAANAHNYIMENDVEKWQDIAG